MKSWKTAVVCTCTALCAGWRTEIKMKVTEKTNKTMKQGLFEEFIVDFLPYDLENVLIYMHKNCSGLFLSSKNHRGMALKHQFSVKGQISSSWLDFLIVFGILVIYVYFVFYQIRPKFGLWILHLDWPSYWTLSTLRPSLPVIPTPPRRVVITCHLTNTAGLTAYPTRTKSIWRMPRSWSYRQPTWVKKAITITAGFNTSFNFDTAGTLMLTVPTLALPHDALKHKRTFPNHTGWPVIYIETVLGSVSGFFNMP